MAVPITVPRLGWSMEEGTFVEWLKRDGDPILPGEALFVLESDKATENVEALDAGILRVTPESPRPGDKVKVGQVIGFVAGAGEPAALVKETQRLVDTPSFREGEAPAGLPQRQTHQPPAAKSASRRSPSITPRARRTARELGIDWSTLRGSGRNDRIRERDIRDAAAADSEGRLIPLTPIRRAIAQRMVAGVNQAAPVTLTTQVDATNLVNLRSQFKVAAESPNDVVPGYTDLILKLTALALGKHPALQAQWRDDGLFVPARIHIAVAVETEAGLLVPVLRDVDKLSLRQVAAQSRELAEQARAGRLTGAQMRGATFTVTNLGMFGVDAFTPLLHLPQSAVLGVGRIRRGPAVVDDQVVPRDLLTLSLTFDHRVVDGTPAARFLDAVRTSIEQPAPRLMP